MLIPPSQNVEVSNMMSDAIAARPKSDFSSVLVKKEIFSIAKKKDMMEAIVTHLAFEIVALLAIAIYAL